MSEWFRDWFNTEEYLYVYRNRNEKDAKKLVDLILRNANLKKNAKVLDLACGTGRHSIFFALCGFKVTAVDLSETLLKVARASAQAANVDIEFIHADMRYFCVNEKFDLIVNLFTSFGYFEEDEENFRLFDFVDEHLEENGLFVLDYFNRNYVENNLVKLSEDNTDGTKIVQERSIVGNRVVKKIKVLKNGIEKNFEENVRMYYKTEIIKEIVKRNMKIKKIFGDFEGNNFEIDKSKRIIIIAER